MALLLKRGLEVDRLTFTPEEGELIYVTDTKLVYVGDGLTPGGILISGGASPPQPTYALSSDVNSINEGESFTITLTTANVANGTLVPYTITGVSSDDINGQSLIGNFVVNSNISTLTITSTADENFENETFILTLVGIIPTNSISVNIIDVAVSGGFPATTIFESTIDGGTPTTVIFESTIDGGIV